MAADDIIHKDNVGLRIFEVTGTLIENKIDLKLPGISQIFAFPQLRSRASSESRLPVPHHGDV